MELSAGNKYVPCKKINMLITYDRIIKDPDLFILQVITSKYYDKFKDYIDMDSLLSLDPNALELLLYNRPQVNILEWVSIKEFDYDKNYKFLYNAFKTMYAESKELKIVKNIKNFLMSYYIDRIFVYNEKDDIRQRYDLSLIFGDSRIEYIVGPMYDILKKFKIHMVYDWNAKRVSDLVDTEEFNHIFFAIASYGFNFEEIEEKDKNKIYLPKLKYDLYDRDNVAFFKTMEFTNKSFLKG